MYELSYLVSPCNAILAKFPGTEKEMTMSVTRYLFENGVSSTDMMFRGFQNSRWKGVTSSWTSFSCLVSVACRVLAISSSMVEATEATEATERVCVKGFEREREREGGWETGLCSSSSSSATAAAAAATSCCDAVLVLSVTGGVSVSGCAGST